MPNEEYDWDRFEAQKQEPADESAEADILAWLCETRELVDHNGC